ncbi:MAG TPA: hypothetical protein DCE11_00900 [Ruminiclostridium sp.]|nr:hypothetical protein [Ruminiclostridium sp.]
MLPRSGRYAALLRVFRFIGHINSNSNRINSVTIYVKRFTCRLFYNIIDSTVIAFIIHCGNIRTCSLHQSFHGFCCLI